ncbi:heliorhodopsin HeR [Subtercola boreus]|uniref:Uncharacterized protein n=1 Tax=Subtercola boreus TaxID=120213 RepID=A0A3E0W9N3_9MICO|nr:heliorhodopsin HeR [Subtercola boreus]RFA19222.1 hypothetical protein B7R23_13200 [Subtercola boreus]RFA25684.1 hypothetical protein B7R25_13320 [Subtercola boreus]
MARDRGARDETTVAAVDAAGRRLAAVAGVLLAVEAVVLTALLQTAHTTVVLPVTAAFAGGGAHAAGEPVRVTLAQVDVGSAVVVLCALVAVARLVAAGPAPSAAGSSGRPHTARWVEYSLTASITVFLVAQLNGVTDVGALVLSYAATSGMVLFTLLEERSAVGAGHPKLALCFGAALGIVPWGIIAFQQIGAGVVGDPPSAIVRVITLVMLAFAAAFAIIQWRGYGERMHTLLSLASTSVFAWLVVLAVVLPA